SYLLIDGEITSLSDLGKRIKAKRGRLWVHKDDREDFYLQLGLYRGKKGKYYEVNVGWSERHPTLSADARATEGIWVPCATYSDAMKRAEAIYELIKNSRIIPSDILEQFPAEAEAFNKLSKEDIVRHIEKEKIQFNNRP